MKVAKLLKITTGVLKTMSEYGIKIDDYLYVEAYESFVNMRSNKMKYRSAIALLAAEYGVSQRTLERAFKRLSQSVN